MIKLPDALTTGKAAARFFWLFAFVIILVSSPDIFYYAIDDRLGEALIRYLFCFGLFAIFTLIFRNHLKFFISLFIPIVVIALVNVFCIVLYHTPLTFDTLILALNTNFQETYELISGYLPYFILLLLILTGVFYLIIKSTPQSLPLKSAATCAASGILLVMIVPIFESALPTYPQKFNETIISVYPGSVIYAVKAVIKQVNLIENHQNAVKNFSFKSHQKKGIKNRQIYVLVIGESSRFNNWQLNHYARKTSPRLSQRGNIISFDHMIAGGYITEFSVPLIITGVTATNFNDHYKEKSIVSAFNEAGFKTYWISNQTDFGDISMHAKEATETIVLPSDWRATEHVHRDMELVAKLKAILDRNEPKVFVVLHTLGSHYNYAARYPENFDFFKPSTKGILVNPRDVTKKAELINSYDNTILYTDAIVDSVISMVQNKHSSSWVSYISDHGENLFDDSRGLSQHNEPIPSAYVAHVPWFMWTSTAYVQQFDDKVKNLIRHKSQLLGSQNVFHTLAEMGNLSFSQEDSTRSVASPYFKPGKQLILSGDSKVLDYMEIGKQAYVRAINVAPGTNTEREK